MTLLIWISSGWKAAHGRLDQPQVKPPEPQPPPDPNPPVEAPAFPVAKAEKARSTLLDLQAGHLNSPRSNSDAESSSSKMWPHFLQLNSNNGTLNLLAQPRLLPGRYHP